jgi:hypothetical protein
VPAGASVLAVPRQARAVACRRRRAYGREERDDAHGAENSGVVLAIESTSEIEFMAQN